MSYGAGRSYGDVCSNDGQVLIDTAALNNYQSFNKSTGLLRCEAGVRLEDLLKLTVPFGWFPPVSPGTKKITIGGAVANDVHGKNHHDAGTFGCHVKSIGLLRSDQGPVTCSLQENTELFKATIGGLGLTGLITWVELQLIPIETSRIAVDQQPFANFSEFLQFSEIADRTYPYTVAWLDCLAKGKNLGRGILMAGRHLTGKELESNSNGRLLRLDSNHSYKLSSYKGGGWTPKIPFDLPQSMLQPIFMRQLNSFYFHMKKFSRGQSQVGFDPFFYPLDGIDQWNRLYGASGFYQWQCVVPDGAENSMAEILHLVAASGQGTLLAVLKRFGHQQSPGLLSFPMPGLTLALDFPNRGSMTEDLIKRLTLVVRRCAGRLYPAKDSLMSAGDFDAFYPHWRSLAALRDPKYRSDFWRRTAVQLQKRTMSN